MDLEFIACMNGSYCLLVTDADLVAKISNQEFLFWYGFSITETEKHLSEMVVSKYMVAKIDRPLGIVCFQAPKDSNDVLNSWASNIEKLLDLVEKSCHQIHKETMVHKVSALKV
ncbi:26S proteasome non-ATPase regulatory subunit 12 A [Asimina triloba]